MIYGKPEGELMKVKITSDSTCDLGKNILDRFNISVVPLNVVLGDKSYEDGVEITPQDIFDYVEKTGVLPKTSATSLGQYEDFFAEQFKTYDAVIHLSLSSKISSSYLNAMMVAKENKGKLFVIDSLSLCAGQGLLAIRAAIMAQEGKEPKEIVKAVEALRDKVVTSFVPDSLDYLHKGGRCSLASMMGAKILKMHPLIVMSDGVMTARKKYMGNMEVSMKRYIADAFENFGKTYDPSMCILAHACAEKEVVDKVRAQLEATFAFDEIVETVAGCTITSHCGKNTMAIFFMLK